MSAPSHPHAANKLIDHVEPLATREQALAFGLNDEEWAKVQQIVGRPPTLTETGIFSALWSEHCSYKSSKVHLKQFPSRGPRVAQGPGENAGAIDLGGGVVAVFKIESHNHPSFIEPVQGAATGVGGILRDIFTMGARPIALMNSLRFGRADHPKTAALVTGVVKGIGGYGNAVGVPTVAGDVAFDQSYDGNILVNAFAMGVCKISDIVRAVAEGPGNLILYLGAKTGRDGIHGATMSSAAFSEETEEKRPTVQVGDPFKEKLLIEACMELFAANILIGIQDMGAAGLTSSSAEMAARGKVGLVLDMAKVPTRELHMTPYEMMLSESQERMLLCVEPKHAQKAFDIAAKWGIDCAEIGRVIPEQRLRIEHAGVLAADLPILPLTDEAPLYQRPFVVGATPAKLSDLPRDITAPLKVLGDMLSSPNLCSRRWVVRQYDQDVGLGTVRRPYSADAAVVRLSPLYPDRRDAIALTVDVNSRWVKAWPREGAKAIALESYRNLCATGATPVGLSDCLNFGNPTDPVVMGELAEACAGLADAARILETPVVSGNVSLYNQTNGQSIDPTPTVAMIGHVPDVTKSGRMTASGAGQTLWLFGAGSPRLDQSEYLFSQHSRKQGQPAPSEVAVEKRACDAVAQLWQATDLLAAAHDVSDGGLLVALAEMVLESDSLGLKLSAAPGGRSDEFWFGEGGSRFVLCVDPTAVDALQERLSGLGSLIPLGTVTSDGHISLLQERVAVSELRDRWAKALPTIVGAANVGAVHV